MWKRSFAEKLFMLLLAVTAPNVALSEAIVRGPYLQGASDDRIRILWRTDESTASEIRYGATRGNLTQSVVDATTRQDHDVLLSGLQANTKYYYAVIGEGGVILAGDDPQHFFVTAPSRGSAKATRIWVIGDSGTANSDVEDVRNAYENFTGSRHTDVWLMLGDNAYENGTDSEYQRAVFDMFPEMLAKTPLWPTLGNHDARSAYSGSQSGPYYDIFSLPTQGEAGGIPSGTEAYYSFDVANIHFVSLDSFDSDRSADGAMLRWLTNDLAATDQRWIIVFWHHPPYSKGSHDSDTENEMVEMRTNTLPILESYGVDLVLSGHSHSYERSYLLNGHYGSSNTLTGDMILDGGDGRRAGDGAYIKAENGPSANVGAVYTVAGSGGKTSGGDLNHPAMMLSLNELGSVVLDVNDDQLDAKFINNSGTIRDRFTLKKSSDDTPPPDDDLPGSDDRKCRSKLRTHYFSYVRAAINAEQKCINAVNSGKTSDPCPDAGTETKILRAQTIFKNKSLKSGCEIDDFLDSGMPNDCDDASDVTDFQNCILAFSDNAVSEMLGVEYANPQPSGPIADKRERQCQQTIAKAAKVYALGSLKTSMKCRSQLDSGRVQACPDDRVVAKTGKLAARLRSRIDKVCSADEIRALNSDGTFGGSCADATNPSQLAVCQRTEHEKILAPE